MKDGNLKRIHTVWFQLNYILEKSDCGDNTKKQGLSGIRGKDGLPWWLKQWRICCSAGDTGDMSSIPGSGRSPGGGNDNPVQHSCLKNPMDRGAWWATVKIFICIYLFICLTALHPSCGMQTKISWGMWDLVSWPGIEPKAPALGALSLSHQTMREVPGKIFLFSP